VAENGHVPALKALADRISVVAVCDPLPARLEAARKHFPSAKLFSSAEALFGEVHNLDFADIATPPRFHFGDVKNALEHGVNVLCEKPLVFSHAEFEQLRALAAKKGLTLFTVHNWKKAPPLLKAREIIAAGTLGEITHVELHVLRSQAAVTADGKNWRTDPKLAGGGIMADHGWHNFYLACVLAGKMPKRIDVRNNIPAAGQAENESSCHIDFGGSGALVFLTWRSPVRKNHILVYGTKGLLEIRDNEVLTQTPQGVTVFDSGEKLSGGSAHPTWMKLSLEDFLDGFENRRLHAENLREALACVLLTEYGYKAAASGRAETLPATI